MIVPKKNWAANTYIRLMFTACGVFTTILFHSHSLHGVSVINIKLLLTNSCYRKSMQVPYRACSKTL